MRNNSIANSISVYIANLFSFNHMTNSSISSISAAFIRNTNLFGRTGLCLILACIIGILTMSGMSSTVELAAANLSATILPRNRAMSKKKGQQSDKVAKNATNNKSKSKTSTNQSVVSTKQAPAAGATIVLDMDTPLVSADKFLETFYSHQGVQTLRFYTKEYWQWDGNAYRKIDADGLRSQLMHFLEKTVAIVKAKGEIVDYMPFPVTSTRVNNIEKVLKSRLYNPADESTPCWISGDIRKQPASVKDPKMLIFCKNTILNLEDMKTLPHSPHWFNLAALDYDYDSKAKCPKWDKFLDSVFGDDKESKQAIMEFMGLCLTCITKFQKALLLIGPKRSGKGTIARIMEKVIGKHNMAPQGTSDFAMDFGFESLVGKTLSITADARFSKKGLTRTTEKILNIVGEDQVKINKKMKDAFHLRMPTKLMFMTNHVPHFPDASGALPSRFITVRLFNSFFGKEDLDLEEKLSAELPGILNYAIKSLKDLLKRGRFIQPKTGMQAVEQMTALSSPIRDFIEDLEEYEHPDSIWEKWGKFCKATREPVRTQKELWANLTAAGYDCDFDAITIMDAVADCGGKATIRDLRDCSRKFHDDPKMLQGKVDEMVKAELLMQFEVKVAGNHKLVVTYMLKPKPIQRK